MGFCAHGLRMSRRTLMAAAAGALTLVSRVSRAQAAEVGTVGLVDFHAHFVPEGYVARATAAGIGPDGMPAWPSWSRGDQLLLMGLLGIDVAVLSVSSPGVHFGDDAAAAALARAVNDEAAAHVAAEPERLRFLASLPLPDVAASLAEWKRIRSARGCVGAIVLSHSGGLYPGNPRFDALWQVMSEQPSLLLVHPTTPPALRAPSAARPRPMLEFYFESARACLDLFRASVVTRFPSLCVIIPHCGGALPMALDQLLMESANGFTDLPADTRAQVRALWFDAAGSPFPTQLEALLRYTSVERVVYGSDYCFTPSLGVLAQLSAIGSAGSSPLGKPWRDTLTDNGRTLLKMAKG
jgi:6-methylsalicylate decarboxylase